MHVLLILIVTAALWGQSAPDTARRHTAAERYALFQQNLKLRAAAITRDQFRGVNNLEDWKRRRPEVRRQLLDMLGLDPMPPRTPLNARLTGGFERPGYRVENIVFESRPSFTSPATSTFQPRSRE